MDSIYLKKLKIVFKDLVIGIMDIRVDDIYDPESKKIMIELKKNLQFVQERDYIEDEIINEYMSAVLHKCMHII